MDSSRHQSDGWDGRRRSRGSRSRRNKASILSSRLDPDFNPTDSVRKENGISNDNNTSRGLNNDELNPKTMNFDELVSLLHPTFISDYLQKVLQYLRSDKLDICFPNLAPFKEEFLLRLVDNTNCLKCNKFSHISRNIARQIIDVLEICKDNYKWTYSFESGRISKNVLVYKKIYHDKSKNSQPQDNFKTPYCAPSSTSAPISLASSLEDLNLNRNHATGPTSRQDDISTEFKIQMLNATMKFIKDDTCFSFDYPAMLRNRAGFLYTLLHSPSKDSDIGFGFKSLYSILFETMEMFKEKYEFKVTYVSSFDVRMAQLRIEKILKDDGQSRQSTDHNTSSASHSADETRLTEKEKKTLVLKRKLIESLPEYFIKRSLQEILDFITDDARGSLEFRDIESKESRFLECVTGLARGQEFYQLFSEDCVILLKKIIRAYLRDTWKLQMDVGKMNKRSKLRTLVMYKVPVGQKGKRDSSMSERLDDTRNDSSCSIDSSVTPRNRSKSKERSSSRRSERTRNNRDTRPSYTSATSRLRTASKDRRNQPPINGIAFQSAGAHVVETVHVDARADGRTTRGIPTRKSKLIEAMSTPLESDRAERMMRLMGWEGGALGARGEGITEPIIPALHILPGAGLGHVKPAPTVPRSPQDFRRYFLQDLLTFLESDQRETAMAYKEPLSRREARFVGPAVNAFNDRKRIGLAREQEVRLVMKISALMMRETELRIECSLSDDKRQVKLKKVSDPNITPKTGRKRKKKSQAATLNSSHAKDNGNEDTSVLNTIMDLENCPSIKSAKALAYRMLFLQKIKDFLTIKDTEKEYKFDCILNIKQRSYIQDVVTSINKREFRAKYSSLMENDMYREIRKVAADCYMSVDFDSQTIILKKKYYQKRFTNSALDLPPPKSKDVKNTVTYINGVSRSDIKTNVNGVSRSDSKNINGISKSDSKNNMEITNGDDDEDDIIILDDNDDDIILLCDSDGNDSITEDSIKTGEPMDTVDSDVKTTEYPRKTTDLARNTPDLARDLVRNTTVSSKKTTRQSDDDKMDSEICDDTSKDVNIGISDESLMLYMFDEGVADTKKENPTDFDLDRDIKRQENAILDTVNENVETKFHLASSGANKEEKHESRVENSKVSPAKHSSECVKTSPINRKDLEINNNFNVIENRNNSIVNTVVKLENLDENDAVVDDVATITPESGICVDTHKDLSPSSSKRSRSDSADSDELLRKYKKIERIAHVRITPNKPVEELTMDTVLKLQATMSQSIDNSFFLPLLQCHGIKNGGLIYSCHNEKSLLWLKNLLTNLDFTVTDLDYAEDKIHKLKFRMHHIDGIEKLLCRLELYNTGLNTNFWEVTEVQTNDGYVMTVIVDDDSFKFISKANFSLFAGVDKALFSIVWE